MTHFDQRCLYIIAGPVSVGKSSVLLELRKQASQEGVAIFLANKDSLMDGFTESIVQNHSVDYPHGPDTALYREQSRSPEYGGTYHSAFDNLDVGSVVIDVPHTNEFKSPFWYYNLSALCGAFNVKLVPIFCTCDAETAYQNLVARNAERDYFRIANKAEFLEYAAERSYGKFPQTNFPYVQLYTGAGGGERPTPEELVGSIFCQMGNMPPLATEITPLSLGEAKRLIYGGDPARWYAEVLLTKHGISQSRDLRTDVQPHEGLAANHGG